MYTSVKHAQIVISLLKQHGIRYIIINPGSTNVPLVQGIQNDPDFICYSIVDERSAMYFAIGLHLKTGERIATTCTSAQATRNYIPGLTEAFYKKAPILAITVSKLPKYDYQGYPQHPIQTSLPEDAVKKTFALPYVTDKNGELQCVRMVNEAILELTHRCMGPVQLNLPMLDSELYQFPALELPIVRVINRYMQWDDWDINLVNKKIMLVIGEGTTMTNKQKTALESFVESQNAFVYINHLSNYQGKYSVAANILLSTISEKQFRNDFQPDILITIGGQTGDYPLIRKLIPGDETEFEHYHVSEDGKIVDTFDKLTKVFEVPFELFFTKLSTKQKVSHPYFEVWMSVYKSIQIPDTLPLSNIYLAQQLHKQIPQNSTLNFAILNSLRSWSFFELHPTITCHSNVGAFGIDGGLSTFLGQSVVTNELCFMVIGDLSFFYDMNSLGIRHLKNNIRILLVNNGCGVEFRMSKQLNNDLKDDIFPYIAAKGHYNNAKSWAESCGFKYISANTKEELLTHQNTLVSESDRPIIFELFVDPNNELEAYNMVIKSNIIESKSKSVARAVLGQKGISMLKKIIKK
jgi:2-succinyl-5-enolpyruvyl-6-hydroxy-3-cyclohexene-1-carboxylate synthase